MTLTVGIRKLVDFLVPSNCALHALAEFYERHVVKTLTCLADDVEVSDCYCFQPIYPGEGLHIEFAS
jgi:hypothetical protein